MTYEPQLVCRTNHSAFTPLCSGGCTDQITRYFQLRWRRLTIETLLLIWAIILLPSHFLLEQAFCFFLNLINSSPCSWVFCFSSKGNREQKRLWSASLRTTSAGWQASIGYPPCRSSNLFYRGEESFLRSDDRTRLVYPVEVHMANADRALLPGMPVEVQLKDGIGTAHPKSCAGHASAVSRRLLPD